MKSVVSEDNSASKVKSGLTPILDKISKLKLESSRKKSVDQGAETKLESRFAVTPRKLKLSSSFHKDSSNPGSEQGNLQSERGSY